MLVPLHATVRNIFTMASGNQELLSSVRYSEKLQMLDKDRRQKAKQNFIK